MAYDRRNHGIGLALHDRIGRDAMNFWTDILPPILVVAVGMGICVAPLATSMMSAVDADHLCAASGFNSALAARRADLRRRPRQDEERTASVGQISVRSGLSLVRMKRSATFVRPSRTGSGTAAVRGATASSSESKEPA